MFKTLARYFLRGLAVVLPILFACTLIWYVLVLVDGFLGTAARPSWHFPGLGILTILVLATCVGMLAENAWTRSGVDALENLLARIPVFKQVHSPIKDFLDAFLGKHKRFDKPVLVKLGGGFDAEVVGFITSEDLAAFGLLEKVAVYLPQSYNIGGNLLILAPSRLTPIDADASTVMAFIVSGGVTKMAETGSTDRELRGYSRRLQRALRGRSAQRGAV